MRLPDEPVFFLNQITLSLIGLLLSTLCWVYIPMVLAVEPAPGCAIHHCFAIASAIRMGTVIVLSLCSIGALACIGYLFDLQRLIPQGRRR